MKSHRERGVFGVAASAAFRITAVEKQTEICGLVRVARQSSTDAMRDFRQNHAGELNSALRLSIKLTGL